MRRGGVEPGAAREDELSSVCDPQVDLARAEVVGEAQQVLGRVDDVVRDPEGPAHHVGRPPREARHRHVGARESVGHLVQRPVAAERDHDVVAALAASRPISIAWR